MIIIEARQVLERILFPIMQRVGLASRVLEKRAVYAVVLAYCGDHQAAAEEVAGLRPFEEAMVPGTSGGVSGSEAHNREGPPLR